MKFKAIITINIFESKHLTFHQYRKITFFFLSFFLSWSKRGKCSKHVYSIYVLMFDDYSWFPPFQWFDCLTCFQQKKTKCLFLFLPNYKSVCIVKLFNSISQPTNIFDSSILFFCCCCFDKVMREHAIREKINAKENSNEEKMFKEKQYAIKNYSFDGMVDWFMISCV